MTHPLRFSADGAFTITQFTDLHHCNGGNADRKTVRLMREILDAHKPDLVVLTGDVIDGGFCRDPIKSYASVLQPIPGLPAWAVNERQWQCRLLL